MFYSTLRLICIEVHQYPDYPGHPLRNFHFLGAQQRHFPPAHLPHRVGREICIQISGGGQKDAGNLLLFDFIFLNHFFKQPLGCSKNFISTVFLNRNSTSYTSEYQLDTPFFNETMNLETALSICLLFLLARIKSTMALPTMTPSDI